MSRMRLFTRSPWLWITLLVLGLLLAPVLLLTDQDPFGLATLLSPTYLHLNVTYDPEGNVIDTTVEKAVGHPDRLASLAECVEEMDQALKEQQEQSRQAGETVFKGQHTCR